MAITTTSLLNTAGLSAEQYGLAVSVAAADKAVVLDRMTRHQIQGGSTLYVPRVAIPAVRTRRGGTENEGDAPTYTALSGTKATMTKRFSYVGYEQDISSLNDMTPEQVRAEVMATTEASGKALAADLDGAVLALYGSATITLHDGTAGLDWPGLLTIYSRLKAANAEPPYSLVLDTSAFTQLAEIPELVAWTQRGSSPLDGSARAGEGPRPDFTMFSMSIYCVGTVTQSTSFRGLGFGAGALGLTVRDLAKPYEEREGFNQRLLIHSDVAYAMVEPGECIEVRH